MHTTDTYIHTDTHNTDGQTHFFTRFSHLADKHISIISWFPVRIVALMKDHKGHTTSHNNHMTY